VSAAPNTTRRDFLKIGSVTGAALVLGVGWTEGAEAGTAPSASFRPSLWLAIASDGAVTITVHRSEMGQGVRTALPMILAEELDVDFAGIHIAQASPGHGIEDMGTGGSDSVASAWRPLRRAGAAAREMLATAAATTWGVDRAACLTEQGFVVHRPTGRRLAYGALVATAATLPVPQDPPLKSSRDFRLVGQRVRRHDGPAIVTGSATYGLDLRVPGMLRAVIARCPVIGGSPARWDAAAAKRVAGVRDVAPISTGLAVVADSTWAALRGRDALAVTWDEGPNAAFSSASFRKQLEDAVARPGVVTRRDGDATAALEGAAKRLEAVYAYPFEAHAGLEPLSFFAHVHDGRCELRGGTQHPERVQREVAKALGFALDRVEVEVTLIGGGFGRRLAADYAVEAAEISRAVAAPVQVMWTHADDLHRGHFECASLHRMEAGLDDAGRPAAWLHRKASAFHNLTPPTAEELADPESYSGSAWGQYDVPYAFPNILTDYSRVDIPVKIGPWRSVFSPPCTFARECFVDEIAAATGRDPLELRLALLEPASFTVAGQTVDRQRFQRVLRLACEKAGWGKPLAPVAGRRVGRGLAGNVYDFYTHLAYVAEVSIGAQGDVRVHRVVCAVDCGQAVNPLGIEGQIESGILWGLSAALKGEITFEAGRVEQSGYDDYPVMSIRDAPAVEVHIVPSDGRPGGMGEPPVPPIAPAVLNAVFAATGRRVRRLPLRATDLA
jgi:isoquinoline 1-oxidoreductase beta subunit